ncbi:MAG: cytochrome P450 [Pseudomonadota bacterium]|nr:cytochrome P450 [Pseudomonadota bacterium]
MPTTALVAPSPSVARVPGWPWSHLLRMRNDPLALMAEGARLGTDVVRLSFGTIPAYVLYAPEVVHRALVPGDTVWKGTRGSKLLRRILGPGLLTTEALVWRDRRRRAQGRFRHEALLAMPGIVQRHADRMIADWRGADPAGPAEVDAMAGFSRLALSVVCEVLFGIDPGEDAARVHAALDEVLAGFLWMMTFPIEGVDQWPLPASRRHRAAVEELRAVVQRLIARRREAGPLEGDLLADWIRAADEGALSQEDLSAEVVTMLLAGHETTANAMSFTLALLATHPEEQDKVRAGLDAGDNGPLERAFNEGLRLYPPAWVLARAASGEVDLGPTVAPKGSFLFIPIAAIHRDPRWWTDPDTFRPDRHLALSPAARAAFFPFGTGPRRCIGEHFARTEARIALAGVLRAFEVTTERVPDAMPTVTLRPRGPVRLTLRPRPAPAA